MSHKNKGNEKSGNKEWKFTLGDWHELPDIASFVGSTFIISKIEMTKVNPCSYNYDIFIASLPQQNPLSVIYKSVIDVSKENKKRRSKAAKSKKEDRIKADKKIK